MKAFTVTTLKVYPCFEKNRIKRLMNLVIPNKPKLEEVNIGNIQIRNIIFEQRGNKIPWDIISNIANETSNYILCEKELDIPEDYDIKRYESNRLKIKLCENAVVRLLSNARINPSELKVSILDDNGEYCYLLDKLIMRASEVKVITNNTNLYHKKSQQLMNQYGVSIVVSNDLGRISPCHILFAPQKIDANLGLCSNTKVFTSQKPCVNLNCDVYYQYKLNLPKEYEDMLGSIIDPNYLFSYLYAEYQMNELAHLIPDYCVSLTRTDELENIIIG